MFSQTDAEYLERLKYLETGAGKLFIVAPSSASYFSELVSQSYPGRVVNSLNRAISLCSSGRGDTVLMLPGDHTESSPFSDDFSAVIQKDAVTVMGFGANRTTYTSEDSDTALLISADGATIRGLTLDCDAVAGAGLGIGASSDGVLVEDCWFLETTPFGFGVNFVMGGTTTCNNAVFRRCRFVNNARGVTFTTDATAKVVGLTIEDCEFRGCTMAISDLGATGDPCEDILIKGCSFLGNTAIFQFDIKGNQGMITQCSFDVAANLIANIGTIHGNTQYICNYTEDGPTTGRPS